MRWSKVRLRAIGHVECDRRVRPAVVTMRPFMVGTMVSTRTIAILIDYMRLELPVTVPVVGRMSILGTVDARKMRARTSAAVYGLMVLDGGSSGLMVVIVVILIPIVLTAVASVTTMRATTIERGLQRLSRGSTREVGCYRSVELWRPWCERGSVITRNEGNPLMCGGSLE